MSNLENIKYEEMKHESIEEQLIEAQDKLDNIKRETLLMRNPNSLEQRQKDKLTIESDLNELGILMARLHSKGVSREIIADTIINSLEYTDINHLCSRLDSFLREVKF